MSLSTNLRSEFCGWRRGRKKGGEGKKKRRERKREVNIWFQSVFTITVREEHMLKRNVDKVDLLEGRRRGRVE